MNFFESRIRVDNFHSLIQAALLPPKSNVAYLDFQLLLRTLFWHFVAVITL